MFFRIKNNLIIMLKLISILLLVIGEAFTIYGEIKGAKIISTTTINDFSITNLLMPLLLVVLGSIGLLVGYCYGIKAFNGIWVVCVVSIGSILIVEPIIAYSLFKEIPSRGATIGLILGFTGMICTLID